jgi:hypothetical protein
VISHNKQLFEFSSEWNVLHSSYILTDGSWDARWCFNHYRFCCRQSAEHHAHRYGHRLYQIIWSARERLAGGLLRTRELGSSQIFEGSTSNGAKQVVER